MKFLNTLLIDLDDTIYPTASGVWPLITVKVFHYMRDVVGIPEAEIPEKRDRLFLEHGTTMRGLNLEYGIDIHDYLRFVHGVDLSGVIKPDPELRTVLSMLPQKKWIFTNASREHANNVLGILGVADQFEGIIDVLDTEPWCKPHKQAFETALKLAGEPDPDETLFADDLEVNLNTARELGIHTLRVAAEEVKSNHPVISSLRELPRFLAQNGFNYIANNR